MRTDASNPYVGLRPFEIDESILFFGRNEQIVQLLQQLHRHHFVAVVGSSGCGKSSLLRAGVIPALKAGYLLRESDQWRIAIMRPAQNPLYNLVAALLNLGNGANDSEKISELLGKMETSGVQPLLDHLVALKEKEHTNFFLLVDQFEELFRFTIEGKDKDRRDEANEFVNMMLELSGQHQVPFYVVMTMRSDFMGDCTQFFGLPEAMNKSLFLVPKLNRVQLKMAIEGPARLYGGKLNAALVSRLLNDVVKFEDELPLLQHTLMRIWDHEMNVDRSGELDLQDYEAIGRLEQALSKHADEALANMARSDFKVAKEVFQALTMIDEHGRKTRRPVLLSQLVELTNTKKKRLLKIVQKFIEGKRSFLILNDVAKTDDKVVDISHESLIREWQRLDRWMDEEAESASIYLRLAGAARLHAENKKDFLTGSELQLILDWKDKFKPSAVWANRYQKGFDRAMDYLKASEENRKSRQAIEAQRLENERRSKKRYRTLLKWAGVLVLISVVALFSTFSYKKMKEKSDEVAQSATKLANLNDSIAKVASQERDELEKKLKLLADAQDSVQSIISQTASIDYSTSVRLNNVSENIGTVIKQSEDDIRKKDVQVKIKTYGSNSDMIYKTLSLLQQKIGKNLKQDELVDELYYLSNTAKSAWNSASIASADTVINLLEKEMLRGQYKLWTAAKIQLKKFNSHLVEIKTHKKTAYSKKSSN